MWIILHAFELTAIYILWRQKCNHKMKWSTRKSGAMLGVCENCEHVKVTPPVDYF